jgi:hypothetical protein
MSGIWRAVMDNSLSYLTTKIDVEEEEMMDV